MTLARYESLLAECGTELEVRRLVLDFLVGGIECEMEALEAIRLADAWVEPISTTDEHRLTRMGNPELRHELHELHEFSRT